MTAVGVAFTCALLGPLASACVFDLRERRIPNTLVAGMAALWCVLLVAVWTVGVASCVDVPTLIGMQVGETAVRGLIGAVALGGGSLVLASAFERATGRSSFGGGDVKLLAVLGLYLGLFGGLTCLLVACAAAVLLAVVIPRTRFGNVPGAAPSQVPFAPALFLGATTCCFL